MTHVKRPASVRCLRPKTCPRPFAGWMRGVLLATQGASGGKSLAPARPLARRTVPSGSAVSATRYREELRQGLAAISRYLTAYQFLPERTLLRLEGQYGTGTVLAALASFALVTRGKEYSVLDHPLVEARLHLPPDPFQQRPESQVVRSLYDCPQVPLAPAGCAAA